MEFISVATFSTQMINIPTALSQPGDHAADKNRTTLAAGDKVQEGVAESSASELTPDPD